MPKRKVRKPKYDYKYVEPIPIYYHNSRYNLEIKPSLIADAGLGVYTNDFIECDTFIDNYTGDYRTRCFSRYYFLIRDDFGIDALDYPRCYMGMLNDSNNSRYINNCKFVIEGDIVSIWSIRNINIGEELFISYGRDYWSDP